MKKNYNEKKVKILENYIELLDINEGYLKMFKINRDLKRDLKNPLIENGITQKRINFAFKHKSEVSRAIHQLVEDRRMAVFKLGKLNYLFLLKESLDSILCDLSGFTREYIGALYDVTGIKCFCCGAYFRTILFQNDIRQWCNNCQKYNLNFSFFYIDEVVDSNYPIQKPEQENYMKKAVDKMFGEKEKFSNKIFHLGKLFWKKIKTKRISFLG